jgi:hypothetical protein
MSEPEHEAEEPAPAPEDDESEDDESDEEEEEEYDLLETANKYHIGIKEFIRDSTDHRLLNVYKTMTTNLLNEINSPEFVSEPRIDRLTKEGIEIDLKTDLTKIDRILNPPSPLGGRKQKSKRRKLSKKRKTKTKRRKLSKKRKTKTKRRKTRRRNH